MQWCARQRFGPLFEFTSEVRALRVYCLLAWLLACLPVPAYTNVPACTECPRLLCHLAHAAAGSRLRSGREGPGQGSAVGGGTPVDNTDKRHRAGRVDDP